MSTPPFELSSTPPPRLPVVRWGVGKPRFLDDLSAQLDPLLGCPAVQVPEGHLAREVLSWVMGRLDLSPLERQYSSLGRHGLHPGRKLAVLVYASLTGVHYASEIERLAKTDAAYRFLSGGQNLSATRLREFKRENKEFFAYAIEQTVRLAAKANLIDPQDLAADSVRLRAEASTKSIRTLSRSEERLEELSAVKVDELDADARSSHEAKVKKHSEAVKRCVEEGRTSLSVTNPLASLMKFPSGAALPGHRVTVVAAGMKVRFVLAVLIGSAATDIDLLRPVTMAAKDALRAAGIDEPMQVAADAGFRGHDDLQFAIDERGHIDVLLNDPPQPRRGKSKRRGGFFSKAEFDFRADGSVVCPAGTPMEGPLKGGRGRIRWRGVGCATCPLRSACTSVQRREIVVEPQRELLHGAMRERMREPGAQARYRRRIATIEPVFSFIEDTMKFQRATSRDANGACAEILLKVLAYNLSRLFSRASSLVALVEATYDGRRVVPTAIRVLSTAELEREWSVGPLRGYSG